MALRLLIVSMLVLLMPQPAPPSAGTITIDASRPGHPIPPNLYGIFFEEISHAGDGGLYAELIQNRGFEDARLPPMSTLEDGFVVPPRTPHFDTGKPSDWRLRWTSAAKRRHGSWTRPAARVRRCGWWTTSRSPRRHRMHSQVTVEDLGERIGGRVAILNEGFWGINVVEGRRIRILVSTRGVMGHSPDRSRRSSRARTAPRWRPGA